MRTASARQSTVQKSCDKWSCDYEYIYVVFHVSSRAINQSLLTFHSTISQVPISTNSMPPGAHSSSRKPLKPCVTRWNSFYDCYEREIELQQAINAYELHHICETKQADEQATLRGNKLVDVPGWMRSNELTVTEQRLLSTWQYLGRSSSLLIASKVVASVAVMAHSTRSFQCLGVS